MDKRNHNSFGLDRNGFNQPQQHYSLPYYRSIDLNDQKSNDLSTIAKQQQHGSTMNQHHGFMSRPEQSELYQPKFQQLTHSMNEFDNRYQLSDNQLQFNRSTGNTQQQTRQSTYDQNSDEFHRNVNRDTRSAEQTFNNSSSHDANQIRMPTNIDGFLPRFMLSNGINPNLINDQHFMKTLSGIAGGGGSSSQQWTSNQLQLQQFKQPDTPLRSYYTSCDTIGNSSSKYGGNRDSSDNSLQRMSSDISCYNDIDYRRTLDSINFSSSSNNLNMEHYQRDCGDQRSRYFDHDNVASSSAVNLALDDADVSLNSTNSVPNKVSNTYNKYEDYVEISNTQRKKLRKKWRQYIRTTNAPRSRDDYARWFKNEIKNGPALAKSKVVDYPQHHYDPDDCNNSSDASSSSVQFVSDTTNTISSTIVSQVANKDNNVDEQLYAGITAVQRKSIRNKWRKFIRTTTTMPNSRSDYVKFVKNQIVQIKNEPESAAEQHREPQKRNRSADSNRNECNKRSRDGANVPPLLREIVVMAKMVIVHSDYPLSIIDSIQADLIKNSLLMALEEETELAPNFKEIRHSGGAVHVACLDEESKQWIEKVVPKIHPWKSATLKAISIDELVKYVKAVVYIPYSDITRDTILHRLAIQNRGLNTSIWRIIRMTTEKIGQTMVVLVDEESAEYLKNKNLTVGLNFTQVKFRFTKKNETNPVKRETNERPKITKEATTSLRNATSATYVSMEATRSSRAKVESPAERRSRDRYSSSRSGRERSRDRRDRSRDDRSRNYSRRDNSSRYRRRSSRD